MREREREDEVTASADAASQTPSDRVELEASEDWMKGGRARERGKKREKTGDAFYCLSIISGSKSLPASFVHES